MSDTPAVPASVPSAAPPARVPAWLWVGFYALLGAFAGFRGREAAEWASAIPVLLVSIALCCVGVYFVWLRDARRDGSFAPRGLLARLIAYGVVGGLLFGGVNLLPTLGIGQAAGYFADDAVRVAIGATLGALLGAAFAWSAAKKRSVVPGVRP